MIIAVSPVPVAATEVYFVPDLSDATYNETFFVEMWLNSTEGFAAFQAEIYFKLMVVNTYFTPARIELFQTRDVEFVYLPVPDGYNATVMLDPQNVIDESDETNNEVTEPSTYVTANRRH